MQCRHCDYRLWGVPGRECPECGMPFRPSEYEFVPNSVRFCCPHCGQDYYGTSEHGHLAPDAFTCVRCGRHVCMDEMTLFLTAGVQEEQTQVETMPWLQREKIGFFRAWFRTLLMGMCAPTRLMALTPEGSSTGQALLFAALTGAIASLFGLLPFMIFPLMMVGLGGTRKWSGLLGGGGILFVGMLWPLVLIGLWSLCAHAILAATGRRERVGRTCQALSYSAAANIITSVPCVSVYLIPVAFIWWSVTAAFMIREGHKVSRARSTAAALTMPAILVAGLACFITFVVVPGIRSATSARANMGGSGPVNTMWINSSLNAYALQHGGRPPAHASELAIHHLAPNMFVTGNRQNLSVVPLANIDLQKFSKLSDANKQAACNTAANDLPSKVVAHRLGDFVFTYHGMNFNNLNPQLWAVVLAPENSSATTASAPAGGGMIYVGLAGSGITTIPEASFATQLAAQNKIRTGCGLPALPDPRKVTHTQPAASP